MLRTEIYRSDLPLRFEIDPMALDDLENSLDETLKFAITEEAKLSLDEIVSFVEFVTSMVCRTVKDRWNGHDGTRSSLHRKLKLKFFSRPRIPVIRSRLLRQ